MRGIALTEDDCREFLERNNLQLLSEYVGLQAKIRVQCLNPECSAEFVTSFNTLRKRQRQKLNPCKVCVGRHSGYLQQLRRLGAEQIPTYRLAANQKYRGAHKPINWHCEAHGMFSQTPHNVRNGLWCPMCHPDAHIK